MFESLSLPHKMSKTEFASKEPVLRGDLIDAQFGLMESGDFPVIVVVAGGDVHGRSAATKRLMSWMDPRHIRPYAVVLPSEADRIHPRMWRFWNALPRKGHVGIFLTTWYEGPAVDFFMGRIGKAQFKDQIEEISSFERLLAQEGALIRKFWFFRRKGLEIKEFEDHKKGRSGPWKVSKDDLELAKEFAERYDHAMAVVEEIVSKTSTDYAPWLPLASENARYRDYTIGRSLADAIVGRLKNAPSRARKKEKSPAAGIEGPNILESLNLEKALSQDDYKARLKKAQQRITSLTLKSKFEGRSLVAVFEGNDAAGKGGSIRRVVQALDPRMVRVIPIAAPNDEERAQPYLWRFWRHIPPKGHVTIFDRSWYGRVLVERVEGFAQEKDWRRAYEEIRSFESQLAGFGAIVVKFWLAIDKDEQLRRFKEREKVGYKRYKITEEDWRNRDKWDAYALAVHDMVDRTSTNNAPWTLVEANDKYFARVKVLETVAKRLNDAL